MSKSVPPQLEPWINWVKYQQDYRDCPSLNGEAWGNKQNHLCAWPGELKLNIQTNRAEFSQSWTLYKKAKIPLSGDAAYWPQDIKVNDKPVVVLEENARPYIQLDKGSYHIKGSILWAKRPESLTLPEKVALYSVTIDGKEQAFPKVISGRLWLGNTKNEDDKVVEKDFLKIWVNRLIEDDHPMKMIVAMRIEAGGNNREVQLTQFSPKLYQLMAIQGELNARFDRQGALWVQVNPGTYDLKLFFKLNNFPQMITFEQQGEFWPQQEIWVYKSNDKLRSSVIEGVPSIDAEQGFMSEWSQLPHFVVGVDDTMKINEKYRGISHSADSLSLNRKMWLSFDNELFYFHDVIRGDKSKEWRINTLPDYRLTHLSNHGEQRLITYDEKNQTGVEIRTPKLDIVAGGTVVSDKMHHASGWDLAFAKTQVELHIPPGRKLLNISGADQSYGDWLNRWKLIDLFFVLLTIAMVFKFYGWLPSAFAAISLFIGYHETNMPMFWWFNFVAAVAVSQKIEASYPKFEKLSKFFVGYKFFSIAVLLFVLLPFIAQQIRLTLYPQLELHKTLSSQYASSEYDYGSEQNYETRVRKPGTEVVESKLKKMEKMQAEQESQMITITGSRISNKDLDTSYEQDAIIQAGKGKPDWFWNVAHFSWNGPVSGDENISLTILSTNQVRALRIFLVVFSVLWLIAILKNNFNIKQEIKKLTKKLQSNHAMLVVFILLSFPLSAPVLASEIPDENLRNELLNRLYPAPDCQKNCLSLSKAGVVIKKQQAIFDLEYQVATPVAGLIPESSDWSISQIQLNGKAVKTVWKNQQGSWVNLPAGISTLTVTALLKDKTNLTIHFPYRPKYIETQITGWRLSGVSQKRMLSNSLQLTQLAEQKKSVAESEKNFVAPLEHSIIPLLLVNRSFVFANHWSLETSVTRQAPINSTISAQVPLYDFERPVNHTDNIQNQNMNIFLTSTQDSFSWRSSIQGTNDFKLVAMQNTSINESWQILVYPNWHIEIDGIPAVVPDYSSFDDFWVYQYFPREGETVEFSLSKPPAVKGKSVAIESVNQVFNVSKRKQINVLDIRYRATRSEPFPLHIGNADVSQLLHDGSQINLEKVDGILTINLKPGEHIIHLTLETSSDIPFSLALNGPMVNQEFSNLSSHVQIPENRWLIYASGSGYGPAVIYWGELIFFTLLALGLSRLSFSPLNYWQWLILGLGMSTFSWPALSFVAVWLLIGEWRRKRVEEPNQLTVFGNWLIAIISVVAVLTLVVAVPYGLLKRPDMGIVGNGSYNYSLAWFLDGGEGALGHIQIYSLPLWVFKGLMLLWATWLSFSLIKWISWIWRDLSVANFKIPSRSKASPLEQPQEMANEQVEEKKNDR